MAYLLVGSDHTTDTAQIGETADGYTWRCTCGATGAHHRHDDTVADAGVHIDSHTPD